MDFEIGPNGISARKELAPPAPTVLALVAATLLILAQTADAAYVDLDITNGPYFVDYNSFPVSHIAPQAIEQQPNWNTYAADEPVKEPSPNSGPRFLASLSPGHILDKADYYWLDVGRYYFLDRQRYNLLGPMNYLIGRLYSSLWRDYYSYRPAKNRRTWTGSKPNPRHPWYDSRGMSGILYGPVLGGLGWCGIIGATGWNGSFGPAVYTDSMQYYILDLGQYHYLDRLQYSLLGGRSYVLGHAAYPLWHGHIVSLWTKDSNHRTGAANECDTEWLGFHGRFFIFNEPAQRGDKLVAFVSDEDDYKMKVGRSKVRKQGRYGPMRLRKDDSATPYKDGVLPGEMVTFMAWDKSTATWYQTEVLRGSPYASGDRKFTKVNLNAVPEPATVVVLALGAIGILLLGGKTNHQRYQEMDPGRTANRPATLGIKNLFPLHNSAKASAELHVRKTNGLP